MRNVGEQRAERDDQLDTELAREVDDQAAERAPAQVRFHAEEQHGVAVHSVWARMVEDRLRPVDPAREPLLQLHVRARRLEVVEALGVDLGEAPRVPALGQVSGCERGALAAVVPAPERSDQDRTLERRAPSDVELSHLASLRGTAPDGRRRAPHECDECDRGGPDRRRDRDVDEHEPPRQVGPVLDVSERHLDEDEAGQP